MIGKKLYLMLLALLASFVLVLPAGASIVINFDDLSTGSGYLNMPATYQGFNWSTAQSDWEVISNSYYRTTYNNNFNFPTNQNAVYNGYDNGIAPVTLSRATNFNLLSASFAAFVQNNSLQAWSARNLTVKGYDDGIEKYSMTFSLTKDFAQQTLNFYNVDKIVFDAGSTTTKYYWLMDNMAYSNVPIPAAAWLLGSGLIGLVAIRRRFKK